MTKFKTSAAAGAQQMRQALKEKWPNIKFSIRSETYSGGNSIRVSWNFGPTIKEVETITGIWQDGYFDGMQDMYIGGKDRNYTYESGETILVSDVKFVFEEREYSMPGDTSRYDTTAKRLIERRLCELQGQTYVDYNTNLFAEEWTGPHDTCGNRASALLGMTAFPSDQIEITDVQRKPPGHDGLHFEDHFDLIYTNMGTVACSQKSNAQKNTLVAKIYSPKSIVITGDTKPVKEIIKSYGGTFNKFLTDPDTKEKVIGWIVPMTKADACKAALNI
jgi:hypothetical protein